MRADLVRAQILVVDVLHLESLRRSVLILADEFFSQPPPHQRFRFGIRAEIIAAFLNDAIVEFEKVHVSDADFGFWIEESAREG